MTDLLRIFRAITPGDVAGIGCIVIIGIWGWPAIAVLAEVVR